jgi:hypothetical protein
VTTSAARALAPHDCARATKGTLGAIARDRRSLYVVAMQELDFDDGEQPVLRCPYCGEPAEVDVDPGGASEQEFEQDCAVCCRPWRVHVVVDEDGEESVTLAREDE